MIIKIGTRGSKLALWQANYVATKLEAAGAKTEIVEISTKGDQILDVAIAKIGSKGVFTEEIELALANGDIDIAVHSAKDMPSLLPTGFSLISFTEREKPNDVVLSHHKSLDWSEAGAKVSVGTSSTRRVAMLKHYYPHLKIVDIRGNLQTRIRKMEEGLCDAIVLAYAGVHRMHYEAMIKSTLPLEQFIPAVGQGSIAVEVHDSIEKDKKDFVVQNINHEKTAIKIKAERSFLKTLQGGCSIPAFALAEFLDETLVLTGGIISLDGKTLIKNQFRESAGNFELLGDSLGTYILENGGQEILDTINHLKN